jgi:hypothetical protein
MSFDEMEYEDLSWIRWDRLRWDLVDLMVSSATQHADRERSFLCTGHSCCLDMQKLSTVLGFEIQSNTQDESFGHIDYREDLYELTTSGMRDGMMVVSNYIRWGSGHPLEGAMEVPFEVARIIHSSYFSNTSRDDKFAPHVSDEPSDEIRELLYAFVKLAFPNEFISEVHQKNPNADSKQHFVMEETWFGEGLAWKRLIIRPFFGEPGLIQGFLMECEYPGVDFHEIDLSHVKSLNQAIREIRGIDLAMFDKFNPLQGDSKERGDKVWEGQGSLWKNLAIYETTAGYVGVLSNSLSFMSDREMKFDVRVSIEEAVAEIIKKDDGYYTELALYSEEG